MDEEDSLSFLIKFEVNSYNSSSFNSTIKRSEIFSNVQKSSNHQISVIKFHHPINIADLLNMDSTKDVIIKKYV